MTGQGPRARAIATGALLGDPPPGRTPWAAPLAENEVPRTGMSPTAATFEPPTPPFQTVDDIRPGVPDEAGRRIDAAAGETVGRMAAPETKLALPAPNLDARPAILDGEALTLDGSADTLRPVAAVCFKGIVPIDPPTGAPIVEWMSPADLLFEGAYQRDLSGKSIDLIRRIVERWDWRRFKPPIVAWTERGFEIIDGQHTAIAAATHPTIDKIPVLVVEAAQVEDRAGAFLGHNRDRLTVTPVQMHRAAVAAGDADALTVQQVIDRAGARIVASMHGKHRWKPGETIAVAGIDALAKKRGAMKARQVLEVLVKAEAAPVSAAAIKAVDMLMHQPDYAEIDVEHLPATIQQLGDEAEREAKIDAKTHCIPVWEALGRVWFRKCRKKRKAT